MNEMLARVHDTLGPAALQTLLMTWLPSLLAATATLVVFYAVHRGLRRLLATVFQKTELDRTVAQFIQTILQFTLGIVGALTALGQLGIDTSSVLASLGVMGLTVGFAAQNTLSNVISGIFIFWDRPFVIGDLIEADGEYGRVETITLRSTRLVTPDGKMVAIPNASIANAKVRSYTNFPNLRLDIPVTVGVEEDLSRVRQVLLSLCEGEAYLKTPAPAVVVKELGDYAVTVELRVWIEDETTHIPARFALRERMKMALDQAKVLMPYETIQLAPFEHRSRSAGRL
jgi:small conductance mechanosensitive channel